MAKVNMFWDSEYYQKDLKSSYEASKGIEEIFRKTILITGATGLVGSFITDVILYANDKYGADIEIYILVRDKERARLRFATHIWDSKLHTIIQDVTKPLKTEVCFNYIIHAAGDGYPEAFRTRPVETMTPAFLGTYHLLEYARKYGTKRFLFVSSGEIYGKIIGKNYAFCEDECGYTDSMSPRSCYPLAKRASEGLCSAYYSEYGVETVVARLSHTYGPGNTDSDNRANVQFIRNAICHKDIVLYSAGKQLRSYTYVADAASGILTILLNGKVSTAYNVANHNSRVTIWDFARILADTARVNCMIRIPDEQEVKELTPIEYAVLDASRLEALGWSGRYGATEGILHTYEILKK